MYEFLKFNGTYGQVVWLVDEAEQNIVEADWREFHKRLVETDDPNLAADVFLRAAKNLL
jgi:hypothetical protein